MVFLFRNEWLGGAVLDVYVNEPIPPESPIWDLSGVFITPHVSGWSNDESVSRFLLCCIVGYFSLLPEMNINVLGTFFLYMFL